MEIGKGLNKFAHAMDDTKTDLAVNDVLEQLAFLVDRFFRLKGVQLKIEPFEPPVRIQTDPFRFQAALFACIDYCLDHTEKGGILTIQGRKGEAGIVIRCKSHPFSGPEEETENLLDKDPGLKVLLGSVGAELSVLNSRDETGLEITILNGMKNTDEVHIS
jgi:hypothetical protein